MRSEQEDRAYKSLNCSELRLLSDHFNDKESHWSYATLTGTPRSFERDGELWVIKAGWEPNSEGNQLQSFNVSSLTPPVELRYIATSRPHSNTNFAARS